MRNKRHNKATKRADLSYVKEALKDRRCWGCIGVVVDDGDGHWEFIDGDIVVDLELQPSDERVSAVMGIAAGAVRVIPPVGTEVIVLVPDGEMDFQPTIVAVTNEGETHGLDESTVVIQAPAGGEVIVHDGSGTAQSLAYKSDVQNVVDAFNDHVHVSPTPVGPTEGPITAGTAFPDKLAATPPATPFDVYLPNSGSAVGAPDPDGTDILKAK